jgi:hypothetical protein
MRWLSKQKPVSSHEPLCGTSWVLLFDAGIWSQLSREESLRNSMNRIDSPLTNAKEQLYLVSPSGAVHLKRERDATIPLTMCGIWLKSRLLVDNVDTLKRCLRCFPNLKPQMGREP